MTIKKPVYLLIVMFLLTAGMSAQTIVHKLVTEYLVNPAGIDVLRPRLSWQLISDKNDVMQTAYEIRVADSPEKLLKGKDLIWNSGKVESDQSVNIIYDGTALKSMQRVYWQVRIWDNNNKVSAWSKPAHWEMGILEPELWKAEWINLGSEPETEDVRPCQYFRKSFRINKKIKSARIYVSSLGLYQLFLNGQKVSPDLLSPGWTSYNKRIQYQVYDITAILKSTNTISAILGDGWYRGNIAWNKNNDYYGNKIALIAQVQITYSDGTGETVVTDNNWKAGNGPILASDFYNGETYDANLEMKGWQGPDYNDSKWENASILEHTKETLVASQGVPVKAIMEIKPIKQLTTPKGEIVFDMGQNMVGWVRLKVQGKKGDKVVLKFAEILDKEGNFYTENLRAAKCTDTYILKGEGIETFEPHFTFHGFRYVKIEGFPGTPGLDNITGIVIHSDMKSTGTFSCSDSLINQLQHNIEWGQRGNFVDVPTDCPQRDERLGWTGDAQVFSMTAAFNFDVAAFYTKWMKDVAADQLPNGIIPHVIPDVLKGAGGSTAWADVAVIIPWTIYQVYGDKRILEEQYNSMKAWVEYMKSKAGEDLIWTDGEHFGDWLAFATTRSDYPGATTEKDLIATAYYCYSTGLLSKIARIIGNNEDADKYGALAGKIKQSFVLEFVTPNGRLVSHTQTAYALALYFDLLPENLKEKSMQYFAHDVKKFGHLTTGFVGTPLLCKSLSLTGRDDLAFMLLKRTKYPSWLYPVTKGATTIWERWDGIKPDGSVQDPGMNSYNHYAYGAIGEWLYSYVAGINPDTENPGYKHIILSPHWGGELTSANAVFESMYGEIVSSWRFNGDIFTYEIEIPANTNATVKLPEAEIDKLKVNSNILNDKMKSKITKIPNGIELKMGSGKYTFIYQVKLAKP